MICPDADFIVELYETCLLAGNCPYAALGEKLGTDLGLFAVSVWTKHPSVRQAFSRVAFFQKEDSKKIVNQDQDVAGQILAQGQTLQGSVGGLHYWAGVLKGSYVHSALVAWSGKRFSDNDLFCLEKLRGGLAVLLNIAELVNTSGSGRVAQELQNTQFMQRQLMPALNSLGGRQFLSYRALPAHELGGDYLDILGYADGSVGLTVADAMGKGVPGAFIMLIARTLFRFLSQKKLGPHRILSILNNQFIKEIGGVDTFVTQFFGIYDPAARNLVYANAGHVSPLLFRYQQKETVALTGRGIALGGLAGASYESYQIELLAGDILVIFSDGLTEARNEDGQQFGLQKIGETVHKYQEYSADGICDGLIQTVLRHSAEPRDDITFLVLKAD